MSSHDRRMRVISGIGLALVWCIALAASFIHIHDLAAAHGQRGWVAWAIAVSVDTTAIVAGLEALRDSRAGRKATTPWMVLSGAAGLTLFANLASGEASPWGWTLAAWPAIASLAMTELMMRRLRHAAQEDAPRRMPLPEAPEPRPLPEPDDGCLVAHDDHPASAGAPPLRHPAAPLPHPAAAGEAPPAERGAQVRHLSGEGLSQRQIADRLGISPRTVGRYLRHPAAPDAAPLPHAAAHSRNGAAPAAPN